MTEITGTMTAQQVADLADVHRRTIIRAIKAGAFPRAFLQNGYEWRIPVADAKAYVETGRVADHHVDGEQNRTRGSRGRS